VGDKTALTAQKTGYIIRGGAEGRERLRILSRIHRASTLDVLQRAGIRAGMTCLDIGCGGGDVSFDMARLVEPDGKVLAMDADDVEIKIARAEAKQQHIKNIEFQVADIDKCELPFGFDFAHARFVLSHLKNAERALAEMHKALRPGGVVVITDTDFRGYFSEPESPGVRTLVDLYTKTLKRRGGDANIGPRLPALLTQSGFENVQMAVVQYAATQGDAKLVVPMTLEYIADAVITDGFASSTELNKAVSDLYEFARDPNTVLSGPRIIQTWARRP